MPDYSHLIDRAEQGHVDAVDGLIRAGADAIPAILHRAATSERSMLATLGYAVRRIRADKVALLEEFVSNDTALNAFKIAVDALGRSGQVAAVPVLTRFAMGEDNGETRRGLAIRARGILRDDPDTRAVHDIAAGAEQAEDDILLTYCVEALTMLGDHTRDAGVVRLLRSPDVGVKLRAASILANLFFPDLLPLLGRTVRDSDAEIRRAALMALYTLGIRPAAEQMATLRSDPDVTTRDTCHALLARLTGTESDDVTDAGFGHWVDEVSYRFGVPLAIGDVVRSLDERTSRTMVVEELRLLTGTDFDYNPDRSNGDPQVVTRARQWLRRHALEFETGACYKFGQKQDLAGLF